MDTNDPWSAPDRGADQLGDELVAQRLAYVYQLVADLLADERVLQWVLSSPHL